LRQVYPSIKLHVASVGFESRPYWPQNDYVRFVFDLVGKWDLSHAVRFLGWQPADAMVEQLRAAHCFVTPSFLENGCNALQEAMLAGNPCVATFSGGLLTTVAPETTGLLFPVGDSALLARQIDRLFQDDTLAISLGAKARLVARERHDPDRVEGQLMRAYEELVHP
jgi:glycosyltransferase involved in cell wall biosynthesis